MFPRHLSAFNKDRYSFIYQVLIRPPSVTVCSEFNHVRTWSVTRFRGMISTQPGPTPLSSFNVVSLEQGTKAFHPVNSSIGMSRLIT